jgi:hypothetical protein
MIFKIIIYLKIIWLQAGQKIKSMTNEKLKVVRKSKGGEDHEVEEAKVDD